MGDGAARLATLFARVRIERRAALLPYLTAGLPSIEASPAMFHAMAEAGADGFEIGIPYSDPLMDGPVIQEAGRRALEGGTTPKVAFSIVETVATTTGLPCIVMTYVNPVLQLGIDAFCAQVGAAGGAGLIVADLPAEEAAPFLDGASRAGLAMALFAAPTTGNERLAGLAALDPGFVYGVADMGVTGERSGDVDKVGALAARVRNATAAPLVLGIGISTPEQARAAAAVGDGVIVGSTLVRRVLEAGDPDEAAASLRSAVLELAAAVRREQGGPISGELDR